MIMSIIQVRTNTTNILNFSDISELYDYIDYNNIIWLKMENITFIDYFNFPRNLEQLFMNNCKLCSNLGYLPKSIIFVEIIFCMLNSINHLFLYSYEYLETLNVSYNRIVTIPKNLPINLISLDLSYNDIVQLPNKNIFSKKIQYINLSYNKLNDLPKWILDLDNDTNLILMPNYFWFNSYSNISLNKIITDEHILIAIRFFDIGLANKLKKTRQITNLDIARINDNYENIRDPIRRGTRYPYPFKQTIITTAEQNQNVHNSDIQDSFSKSVAIIMTYHAPKISYVNDVWYYYIFDGINIVKNILIINQILSDCKLTTVISKNGVMYSEIFERIWSISNIHTNKTEIRKILKDEIYAGIGVCFTGRVTRLVNVLCGFIDGIQIGYSENEQINNAIIATRRRCEEDKTLNIIDEAKKILTSLSVSDDKQQIWLEALE